MHAQGIARPVWVRVWERLRDHTSPLGVDLVRPLQLGWYNQRVESANRIPPAFGDDGLAVLFANSAALWRPFVESLRRDPELCQHPNPIDHYTRTVVERAIRTLPHRCEIRWSTDSQPRVAIQRLAEVAGLACLSPSHLSVSRTFGPWIALRAVALIKLAGPPDPMPEPQDLCGPCRKPCMTALKDAMTVSADREGGDSASVRQDWSVWVRIRDACPYGQPHRYSAEQVRYHYQKDRAWLRRWLEGG